MPAIVLIGPMGAGKTSVGKKLAKRLGVGFTDTDAAVVREHGPIEAIFAEHGEPAFRAWEADAVRNALAAASDGGVVALGGGAVLAAETRALLADHRVVLLTVTRDAVAARIVATARPLLAAADNEHEAVAHWDAIAQSRDAVYRELADLVLDTSSRPMEGIADAIAEWSSAPEGTP